MQKMVSDYLDEEGKHGLGNYESDLRNLDYHCNSVHHPVPDSFTQMRGQKIACRVLIPTVGGYREYNDLTDAGKESFGRRCAERMGAALNDYFSQHIEEYKKL